MKATYLLAVAFLEIIRFISNGGILNGDSSVSASRSAFSCVFEYLKTPNLTPAVSQCLTAIVHRSFETAVSWLVCKYPVVLFELIFGQVFFGCNSIAFIPSIPLYMHFRLSVTNTSSAFLFSYCFFT